MTDVPLTGMPVTGAPVTGPRAPLESEGQARRHPAVRAIYAAAHASRRRGVLGEGNHRLLCGALAAAQVPLGAYDHRIVAWLADLGEPQTCLVVAGLVQAAYEAGTRAPRT